MLPRDVNLPCDAHRDSLHPPYGPEWGQAGKENEQMILTFLQFRQSLIGFIPLLFQDLTLTTKRQQTRKQTKQRKEINHITTN